MNPTDLDLKNNYVDLAEWFASDERSSYCDWEGLADGQACLDAMKKALGKNAEPQDELERVTFTLTLHFVYGRCDTYEMPGDDEILAAWEAYYSLLGSRWWMKETAKGDNSEQTTS